MSQNVEFMYAFETAKCSSPPFGGFFWPESAYSECTAHFVDFCV